MRIALLLAASILIGGCQSRLPDPAPPAPGLTTAWVTFDAGRLRDSGATGLADRTSGRRATADDPVRIASVSKLVVAIGVMRLVEAGRLDLDADVARWLGRPLRNPAHPDVPITLRMLLSHRSSLKDEGDNYVIPLGRTVREMTDRPETFDTVHRRAAISAMPTSTIR
jgi:CubicO group peptidase (beta-lactamase class C family)